MLISKIELLESEINDLDFELETAYSLWREFREEKSQKIRNKVYYEA